MNINPNNIVLKQYSSLAVDNCDNSDSNYEEVEINWEDIRPGDVLEDGSIVTQVHEPMDLDTYKIVFKNKHIPDIEASFDHLFKTKHNNNILIPRYQNMHFNLVNDEENQEQRIETSVEDSNKYSIEQGWMTTSDLVDYYNVFNKYPKLIGNNNKTIRIKSINYIGKKKCRCITTNTGQYTLTKNGPINHNSVLLNTIIAHFVNKKCVDLYLSDPKGGVEFGPYEDLPEVKGLAKNLPDSVEVFKLFKYTMDQRYVMMDKLGIKNIPLDNMVDLGDAISIDGNIYKSNEQIKVKINGKEKLINAVDVKTAICNGKIEFLIPENQQLKIEEQWITTTEDKIQIGGQLEVRPMVFLSDEYAELIDNRPRSEYRMVEDIQNYVQSIARLGRAAHVHIIIATQSSNTSLFPSSLKNNLQFRAICGKVDANISRMAVDTEEGETIPTKPKGMYLASVKGESAIFQGYFTKTDYIKSLSSIDKKDKNKNDKTDTDSSEHDINNTDIEDENKDIKNENLDPELNKEEEETEGYEIDPDFIKQLLSNNSEDAQNDVAIDEIKPITIPQMLNDDDFVNDSPRPKKTLKIKKTIKLNKVKKASSDKNDNTNNTDNNDNSIDGFNIAF